LNPRPNGWSQDHFPSCTDSFFREKGRH
jgi:hypothetical protein